MLERQNLRITRQRRIILKELKNDYTHPSADQLYDKVRQTIPRISLATVYRNLRVLCRLGEIQKLKLGYTQKRFDPNPDFHYHMRCLDCDRLDDAPLSPLKSIEDEAGAVTDYKVLGHRLEFVGFCPQCSIQS